MEANGTNKANVLKENYFMESLWLLWIINNNPKKNMLKNADEFSNKTGLWNFHVKNTSSAMATSIKLR